MYLITDDYGTRQRAWTRSNALEWLAAAGENAIVRNLWGRVVARRSQARIY